MKPIAVLQHTEVGAPGSVVPILESMGHQVEVIRIGDAEPVPSDASRFGGLVFLGGYMGVGDNLPWIGPELSLIRDADSRGLPVAGHCLGSQLVAVALGGHVYRQERPEIGWNDIATLSNPTAQDWWGRFAGDRVQTFQWHGDTFVPPVDAVQIARAEHCENQAFVLRDRHLMLQSHLEMTPDLVKFSLARNGAQLDIEYAAGNPAVTSMEETRRDLCERTAAMRTVLHALYSRWVKGCQ